jgi:hypothetical protein
MANKSSNPVKKFVSAEYSITNGDSGAAGSVTPKKTSFVPENAIMTDCIIHCNKAVVSSTGTIKVEAGGRELTVDVLSSHALATGAALQPALAASATAIKSAAGGGHIKAKITGTVTAGEVSITVGYIDA